MSGEIATEDRVQLGVEIEKREQEVAIFKADLAKLELEDSRSPALLRMLARAFGFGAAGKLERARFKLGFKQEELSQLKTQDELRAQTIRLSNPASDRQFAPPFAETTEQKMERMITENPAELAPHIRRIYQQQIKVERLASQ